MTVYVDNIKIRKNGRLWYHLMSDTNDDEIHIFASRIGLKRSWFQSDHYDITAFKRTQAIKVGAIEISAKNLVEIRRQKRKGKN